jgi:hypothetical protein
MAEPTDTEVVKAAAAIVHEHVRQAIRELVELFTIHYLLAGLRGELDRRDHVPGRDDVAAACGGAQPD